MSQDQSAPILHFPKSSCTEEVVFVVGEGERLGSSDCVDATPGTMKCDKRRNYAETDKERVQPEPSTMASTAVRDYSDEPLVDVYVSLQRYYRDRNIYCSSLGASESAPKLQFVTSLTCCQFFVHFQKHRGFFSFTLIAAIYDMPNL